jgi:predicted acetyltransferase
VASARLYHDSRSPFASLWGGSTVATHRKQGFYTALLAVRVQEAIRRGARYLTIDASPMSRPIVARFGFMHLTTAYACNWSAEAVNSRQ